MGALKNIYLLIFIILLFSPIVYSSSNRTKTYPIVPNPLSLIMGENKENDALLSCVEIEREILKQKQGTYDTFLFQQASTLSKFMIIVSIFGIVLAIFIGFMTVLGLKYFDLKFQKIKEELFEDQKAQISNKILEIKSETTDLIKDIHEVPIDKLKGQIAQTDYKLSKLIDALKDNGIDIMEDIKSVEDIEGETAYKKYESSFKDEDIEIDSDEENKKKEGDKK